MKTPAVLLTALAIAFALPPQAHAGSNDKTWIAVGSFLGGAIIGSHIQRDRDRDRPVVYQSPTVIYRDAPSVVVINSQPSGYWRTIETREYVPERITITTDRSGRQTKVIEAGHYVTSVKQVWVDTTAPCSTTTYTTSSSYRDKWDR
jgi:hypothetical protein